MDAYQNGYKIIHITAKISVVCVVSGFHGGGGGFLNDNLVCVVRDW